MIYIPNRTNRSQKIPYISPHDLQDHLHAASLSKYEKAGKRASSSWYVPQAPLSRP